VAIQPAARPIEHVRRPVGIEAEEVTQPVVAGDGGSDVALDFVRFCYRRRRVAWPALYDEMCAVAGRGVFRGMGYTELAEHGVSFCLSEMQRLVSLTERVVAEERNVHEPGPAEGRVSLTSVEARA
jgi:hypothetical protein